MEPFSWKRKNDSLTPAANIFLEEDEDSSEDDQIALANQKCAKMSPEKPQKNFNTLTVLANKEERAVALGEKAVKLAEEGQFQKSIVNFNKSLELKPDAKLFEMYAQALNEMGRHFDAIQACEKAIKLKPNWSTALHTLGRCQYNFMQPEMAVVSLKKAVHLNPLEPEAWTDLTIFFKHSLKIKMQTTQTDSAT